jgi:hypothetical protein
MQERRRESAALRFDSLWFPISGRAFHFRSHASAALARLADDFAAALAHPAGAATARARLLDDGTGPGLANRYALSEIHLNWPLFLLVPPEQVKATIAKAH